MKVVNRMAKSRSHGIQSREWRIRVHSRWQEPDDERERAFGRCAPVACRSRAQPVYSERKRSAIAISPGGVLEIERCQPTAARRWACFAVEGTREGEAGRGPVA